MFGSIGGAELLLIFVLALLLFGPRKLPEIGKTVGKTLAEFKRATNDFKSSLEREVEMEKLREVRTEVTSPLAATVLDPPRPSLPVPYAAAAAPPSAAPPRPADDRPAEDPTARSAGGSDDRPGGVDDRREG